VIEANLIDFRKYYFLLLLLIGKINKQLKVAKNSICYLEGVWKSKILVPNMQISNIVIIFTVCLINEINKDKWRFWVLIFGYS
jgi:hypothetical protein